jgi:hypothetical protein
MSLSGFMNLWETQILGNGQHPIFSKWTAAKYDLPWMRFFRIDEICLHPVEVFGTYAYAHMPMYDKIEHPEVARFAWFSLIEFLCGTEIEWLDLGASKQGTWKQLCENRDDNYKWGYVPKNIEPQNWWVQLCECGWRQLITQKRRCDRCASGR